MVKVGVVGLLLYSVLVSVVLGMLLDTHLRRSIVGGDVNTICVNAEASYLKGDPISRASLNDLIRKLQVASVTGGSVSANGSNLDRFRNPYEITLMPTNGTVMLVVQSFGPDGVRDSGDDIVQVKMLVGRDLPADQK